MPKYNCERCGKDFKQKCDYDDHINRKIPCKEFTPNCSKVTPNCSKKESILDCKYCGKKFTRQFNLMRHIDKNCKIKKENDNKMEEMMTMLIEMKEDMRKLKEENAQCKKIINNTQNIQTQNVINVKILAYGQEDPGKITINDYKKILGRGMNSVPALVEKMHFDQNFPENHNVYISNMRDEYVLMYDGKKWRLKDREEALQQLYEDKSDILETKFEELLERLDEPTIKMFNRFLKIKDIDDDKVKCIKKELKKTLYENREIAIKTKRIKETEDD